MRRLSIKVLININTLTELNRLLGTNLKKAGHPRYSENAKKIFKKLSDNYQTEFCRESLNGLLAYRENLVPLFINIQRNSKSDQLNEYMLKMRSEIERLIHMHEKNLT